MRILAQLNSAARWLVVVLTSLMLLDSAAATASPRPPQPACSACVRCQCCVKDAPGDSRAPLAPVSPPRAAPDFQWLFTVSTFLSVPEESPGHCFVFTRNISFRPPAPLYQRHCSYLI